MEHLCILCLHEGEGVLIRKGEGCWDTPNSTSVKCFLCARHFLALGLHKFFNLDHQPCLSTRKPRPREVKQFAQGHIAAWEGSLVGTQVRGSRAALSSPTPTHWGQTDVPLALCVHGLGAEFPATLLQFISNSPAQQEVALSPVPDTPRAIQLDSNHRGGVGSCLGSVQLFTASPGGFAFQCSSLRG